jgi:hypothetical protein
LPVVGIQATGHPKRFAHASPPLFRAPLSSILAASALTVSAISATLPAQHPTNPTTVPGAVPPGPSPTIPSPSPVPKPEPTPIRTEIAIDSLRSELAELRGKLNNRPKDIWDKLTALSGIISGVVVALIGFYATNVYSRRQKASDDSRKDHELLVAQIQTVEKFLPHLSSQNAQVKGAALVAIAAMGNAKLAVELAKKFGGTGATSALTAIASSPAGQGSAVAKQALQDALQYLKPRVVSLHDGNERRATGFWSLATA